MSTTSVAIPPSCSSASCSHSLHSTNSKLDKFICVLEKVCLIFLVVFSAVIAIKLFVPFFLTGIAFGTYEYVKHKNSNVPPPTVVASCSQGLMEELTGMRFPKLVSLSFNVAATAAHVHHHPLPFTCFLAWVGGFYVAKQGIPAAIAAYKKVRVMCASS